MVPFLFLVVGCVMLASGLHRVWVNAAVARWPTTTGHLESKEVRQTQQAAAAGPGAKYEVFVRYTYAVGDRRLAGDALFPTHHILMREDAEKFAVSLPESVQVRFDPSNPERSYLFADPFWLPAVAALAGLVFFAGGAVALLDRR